MPCGPDPEPVIGAIEEMIDAGIDHVYLHQIGPDQEGFCRFWTERGGPPSPRPRDLTTSGAGGGAASRGGRATTRSRPRRDRGGGPTCSPRGRGAGRSGSRRAEPTPQVVLLAHHRAGQPPPCRHVGVGAHAEVGGMDVAVGVDAEGVGGREALAQVGRRRRRRARPSRPGRPTRGGRGRGGRPASRHRRRNRRRCGRAT